MEESSSREVLSLDGCCSTMNGGGAAVEEGGASICDS